MERIDKVVAPLKSRLQKQTDPERELDRILDHPSLRSFRQQHPEYPREMYRRSLPQLRQMVTERKHCDHCPGLNQCPNLVPGYRTELQGFGGYLDLRLAPCEKRIAQEEEHRRKQLIRSHYIPTDIIQATFDQMEWDSGRADAIEAVMDFCEQFESGRPRKGLYLYGPFGVGKSRIAGAMAQYLVRYGIDSLMVYVPDFVREIKESIRDGQIQRKLDALRQATVLIMDDVGAENITPWIRDEIFGAILQYRMVEKLPTVYTSNLGLDELEEHWAHSDKGGIEKTKAKRIMERIRPYVEVCYVDGPNRRLV
ncbi:MAG: primosomal protein DnaI [Firmicutes bacterium]|uniref:Primosomal protein DnaI n=1 Tax=Melghirimyces thermohalophilus TaxID=1236220 RepID=A0A1G6MN59_9BACL|nr:primosomal protein DnaI [Melghirimyces thermohalophilus]MDA8353844.1 primosomal protein DnaI [Bacillota bacterium]SDC56932.1 primosomal protein DnaI [Melghirimyces thermohalophilus]